GDLGPQGAGELASEHVEQHTSSVAEAAKPRTARDGRQPRWPGATGAVRSGRIARGQSASPSAATSTGGASGSSARAVPAKVKAAVGPSPSTSTTTIWPGPTSPYSIFSAST